MALTQVQGGMILASGQSIPSAALPVGSVLQVVQGTYSISVSNSTSTFADTGVTATITPKFSTSKVLILATVNGLYNNANSATDLKLAIFRGATNLNAFLVDTNYIGTATALITSASANFLDSPASSSALTYKIQFARNAGAGTVNVQSNGDVSSITLLEIAA
jgi:hypothetical protein